MDWIQVITVFCIPAFAYMLYEISRLRRELWEFKEEAAKEYATNEVIVRMENKIDDLRNLIIAEFSATKKGSKK